MITKDNIALLDSYDTSTDLGPLFHASSLAVQVFNNSATFLVYKQATDGTQSATPQGEITVTPGSFTIPGGIGYRAKNALAGSTARIFAQLYEKADVQAVGYVPNSQTIAASGQLTTSGQVITYPYGTSIDVNSTAAETDILQAGGLSIPANQLLANGWAEIELHGSYLSNAGVASYRLRIYFGGQTLYDSGARIPSANSANRRPWWIRAVLMNQNAANAQRLTGAIIIGDADAPTVGIGQPLNGGGTAPETVLTPLLGSVAGTVDTTAAATLRVTWTWGNANASSFLCYGSLVKVFSNS